MLASVGLKPDLSFVHRYNIAPRRRPALWGWARMVGPEHKRARGVAAGLDEGLHDSSEPDQCAC
jgi:hypothetical protein